MGTTQARRCSVARPTSQNDQGRRIGIVPAAQSRCNREWREDIQACGVALEKQKPRTFQVGGSRPADAAAGGVPPKRDGAYRRVSTCTAATGSQFPVAYTQAAELARLHGEGLEAGVSLGAVEPPQAVDA